MVESVVVLEDQKQSSNDVNLEMGNDQKVNESVKPSENNTDLKVRSSRSRTTTRSKDRELPNMLSKVNTRSKVTTRYTNNETSTVEQRQTRVVVSFDSIDLSVVLYDRRYSSNRGSISQLIVSLRDMKERIDGTATSDYQRELYSDIQMICQNTVDIYEHELKQIPVTDYRLYGYYLNGAYNNGKLRRSIARPDRNGTYRVSVYGHATIRKTLHDIDDRVRHIKYDCINRIKNNTSYDANAQQRLIEMCDRIHTYVVNALNKWTETSNRLRVKYNISNSSRAPNASNNKNSNQGLELEQEQEKTPNA